MSRTYRYVFNASIVRFRSPHDGKHLRRRFPAPPHHLQVYQDAHFQDCSYCCKHTLSTPAGTSSSSRNQRTDTSASAPQPFAIFFPFEQKHSDGPVLPEHRRLAIVVVQDRWRNASCRFCQHAVSWPFDALVGGLTDSNLKVVWNRTTPSVSILPTLRKGYATDPAAGEIERRFCRCVRH